MGIEIRALSPELEEAYFDFFDHRAFSQGSPGYPCYCNGFNMRADEIAAVRRQAALLGGGTEGWKSALRESAVRMLREGRIRGYLAFEGGVPVGWCNANDRMRYYRVGEFDLDHVPEDRAPSGCQREGQIKSVVCFEISPDWRGRGVATRLLERVCADARCEGYAFVEAYPNERAQPALAFTGPIRLYQRAGFAEFSRVGPAVVMRKPLSRPGPDCPTPLTETEGSA